MALYAAAWFAPTSATPGEYPVRTLRSGRLRYANLSRHGVEAEFGLVRWAHAKSGGDGLPLKHGR